MSVFSNPWNNLKLFGRRCTSRWRAEPDFIIIGTQKSGTTTLHSLLGQHPDLVACPYKEPHYFSNVRRWGRPCYEHGPGYYRSFFPLRSQLHEGQRVFESSAAYASTHGVAARIHHDFPHMQLILLARNPVERSISHYFMRARNGLERRSVEEAMTLDLEATLRGDKRDIFQADPHDYLRRSIYADMVEEIYKYFDPSQLLVIRSEDLFENAASVLGRVAHFLHVSPEGMPAQSEHLNVGTNRKPISDELRKQLEQFFIPHNQRLYALIGQDFAW